MQFGNVPAEMAGTLLNNLRRIARARGAAAFLTASAIVGALVGLAGAALVVGIQVVGEAVDLLGSSRLMPLAIVPAALVIAWILGRSFGPGVSGGGVTDVIVGLSIRSGYLSSRTVAPKLVATAVTLGAGGSAGREGPAVHLGGTIGSAIARRTRFGEDQIRSLVTAGAAAGVGAVFNAPIAGMLFGMEVLLGNLSLRHLNSVIVASVAAAVTTRSLVGEDRLLSAPAHSVTDPRELLLYVVVGLAAVVFGLLFLRMIDRIEGWQPRAGLPGWAKPVGAGLILAAIGAAEPRLLGTGQEFVATLLRLGRSVETDVVHGSVAGLESLPAWAYLVVLGAAKPLMATLTRAGGGSGGTFMPSLFIGAAAGAAVAELVSPIWGISELEPGAFAVVGMAATLAAVERAPLTSIILVFEITGDYGLVLPLMLASSLATFVAERIHPESGYTIPLRRRSIHLTRHEDIDLLDTVTVGDVMSASLPALAPAMTTAQAKRTLDAHRHHGLPVVDRRRLVGVLTITDISARGGPSEEETVSMAMTADPITVTPSMPVSAALARMASLGVGRLPVVSDDDPTECLGVFRRESVVRAYHHALGASTDRSLYRERLRARVQPGATFFEIPVPRNSEAAGRRVRDLDWPDEAILVSIRRGGSVLIPHGDTRLGEGDTVTAFGTPESRVAVAYLLEPPPSAGPNPGELEEPV